MQLVAPLAAWSLAGLLNSTGLSSEDVWTADWDWTLRATEVSVMTEDTVQRRFTLQRRFTAGLTRTVTPETRRHIRRGQRERVGHHQHVETEHLHVTVNWGLIWTEPEETVETNQNCSGASDSVSVQFEWSEFDDELTSRLNWSEFGQRQKLVFFCWEGE